MDFPNLLMASPIFDRLKGCHLERVTWNGPVVALIFRTHTGNENLLIHLRQDVQGLHLDSTLQDEFEHIQFQDRRHDFTFLPPHLEGAIFLGARYVKAQSLVCLKFSGGSNFKDDRPLRLFLEFFAGGRLVLTDFDNRVIRASRKGGAYHKPGMNYPISNDQYVKSGQEVPLEADAFSHWPSALLTRVKTGGTEPVLGQLCHGIMGFKPDSVRYLVQRKKPHPNRQPEEILAIRLSRWITSVQQNQLPIHVLSFTGVEHRGCQIYPFKMDGPDGIKLSYTAQDSYQFKDYVTAVNFMGRNCLARMQMMELIEEMERVVRHRQEKSRRLLRKMEVDWEKAAEAGDLRRQADSLAAHLGDASRGMDQIELEDVHEEGKRIIIPLNPVRNPEDNLSRLYKKAAKGERGIKIIEMRMDEVRQGITADEEMLEEKLPALYRFQCRTTDDVDALRKTLKALGDEASLLLTPARSKQKHTPVSPKPFRRFELPGGWLVLVGRNNKENDLLTHKEAASRDLWFHAEGVAGSHVILKTGGHKSGPPKSVVETAAEIAAFYSKGRNSNLVPVIYTEKRYVRKPRKGAPGLALCTREQTIFVKPRALGK
jgi:predicted ribosome quality control (RQC) complex YloA/Tae2 family protein